MTGETTKLNVRNKDDERTEFFEVLEAVGTTSPPIRFQGNVTVQISGSATNVTAIVERSSRGPNTGEENWAPAENTPFSGDLSAGIAPREYVEPAIGWWRVRVPTLTGGNISVSIIGETA